MRQGFGRIQRLDMRRHLVFLWEEILEEREELSVDALFAQAALSSDEENGRGDSTKFALPKTDTEIEQAQEKSIPKKTRVDTHCLRVWEDWRNHRQSLLPN